MPRADKGRIKRALSELVSRDTTKVSVIEMYSSYFFDRLTRGRHVQVADLGEDKLQIGYNRVYTNLTTKAYYFIKSFPIQVQGALLHDMRLYCFEEGVNLHFNINMVPHTINWKSAELQDYRRSWNAGLEEAANSEKEFLATLEDDTKEQRDQWLINSWKYVSQADANNKAICTMDCIIEVATRDNKPDTLERFETVCYKLEQYGARNKIELKRVEGMLLDFIQYSSPLSANHLSFTGGMIPRRILIDESIANMTTFTGGKLSQEGLYVGIDVETGMLVYLNMDNIMDMSKNVMVAASSRGGKSFMVKGLIQESLANRISCIVLDRDGEYKALARKTDGIVIDFDKANGTYFDSMQIGDLTGIPEIDNALYTEAVSTTTSVFNILTDPINGMSPVQRAIFSDAINLVMYKAGVFANDKNSWKNADRLCYADVFNAIVYLSRNGAYQARYGQDMRLFVDTLKVFFGDGIRSYMFKRKISIKDILGRVKKNESVLIDLCLYLDEDVDKTKDGMIEQSVKQMTTGYLTVLLVNYFRSLGLTSAVFLEEYQRYIKHAEIQSLVLNLITGNGKRNSATFLVTNSPQEITTQGNAVTMALADNIRNLFLGKIESTNTISQICKLWNIPNCEKLLVDISEKPEYRHCFLTRFDNGEVSVVKHCLPDELAKSELFSSSEKKKRVQIP